jgi:hypothetical protein
VLSPKVLHEKMQQVPDMVRHTQIAGNSIGYTDYQTAMETLQWQLGNQAGMVTMSWYRIFSEAEMQWTISSQAS